MNDVTVEILTELVKSENGLQKYNRHAKRIRAEYKEAGLYKDLTDSPDTLKNLVHESIKEEAAKLGILKEEEKKPEKSEDVKINKDKEVLEKEEKAEEEASKKPVKTTNKSKKKKFTNKSLGIVGERKNYLVPVSKINLPENLRDYRESLGHLPNLEKSIKFHNGILDTVRVKITIQGELEALNHFRVLKAAKQLEGRKSFTSTLKPVEVHIVNYYFPEITDEDELRVNRLDYCMQDLEQDINLFKIASLLKTVIDSGMSINRMADYTGFSLQYIKNKLKLLEACEQVEKFVNKGSITEKEALEIIKDSKNDIDQKALLNKVISRKGAGNDALPRENVAIAVRKVDRVLLTETDTNDIISPNRARMLLATIANIYTSFMRGGKPAKKSNDEYEALLRVLNKVQLLKVKGKLPLVE